MEQGLTSVVPNDESRLVTLARFLDTLRIRMLFHALYLYSMLSRCVWALQLFNNVKRYGPYGGHHTVRLASVW